MMKKPEKLNNQNRRIVCGLALAVAVLASRPVFAIDAAPTFAPAAISSDEQAEDLYAEARDAIEDGNYNRAIDRLNKLITLKTPRTDAALYWKAYSLAKNGQRADALTTLSDLQKQFGASRWFRDARALEVEIRQASGQPVSPDAQNDEELKLLALRGLMQSDPDGALPMIERILNSAQTPKVKDRALFVLSQSHASRAREIIVSVAKGTSNPDLQLRAIRYIGIMGGGDNRQVLADVYNSSSDRSVKRSILRSFMVAGDRARLFGLAKAEKEAELRAEAVQQLGVMGAHAELAELYASETSVEVKKRILQAMFVGGNVDKLSELARNEKDPELRRAAIRNLGLTNRPGSTETLLAIYSSDQTPETRKAVINALFVQNNAKALVDLARAEKDPQTKKEIVSKLAVMKSKEATDYLLELLK